MTPEEALSISRKIASRVKSAISDIKPTELGFEVGMGKDGTPTKKVDKIAENAALNILRDYDVTVVSEEAGIVGDGEVHVALDPIDGTFNAGKGIPFFSVSLCFSYSEKLGDTFFGYVKNLALGIEYWADGNKAYRDGKPVNVSEKPDIFCDAIVYYPEERYGFRRIRIMGSAALENCLVADGTFDCFIDHRGGDIGLLRVYDVAAGLYIAKCAGAVITDTRGKPLNNKVINMEERFKLIVSNGKLHPKLLELFG